MIPQAGRDAARDKKGNFTLELGPHRSAVLYLTTPSSLMFPQLRGFTTSLSSPPVT